MMSGQAKRFLMGDHNLSSHARTHQSTLQLATSSLNMHSAEFHELNAKYNAERDRYDSLNQDAIEKGDIATKYILKLMNENRSTPHSSENMAIMEKLNSDADISSELAHKTRAKLIEMNRILQSMCEE
ncbi:hypothetical protein EhVM1_000294 [Emiliania huxleyi virus M1]|nr:hypothetical protein EhVM1_000294 [Emiliania huxleyi virus M1]